MTRTAPRRPSLAAANARRLLTGAAVGGHVGAVVAVGVAGAIAGRTAALSAALGAVLALAFSIVGHAVQVAVADAPVERALVAALASYGIRVGMLGVALAAVLANADSFAWLQRIPLVAGTLSVVVAWLAAEIWVFSHLRVGVFDFPDDAP